LPSVDDALRLLQEVQQRCREVWASAEDYFGPSFGTYFLDRAGKYNQRGEFIVDFNPELQAVGNFVARCLMVRATTAIELLTNTIKELQVALVSENFSQTQPWHQPQERTRQLLQDLRQRCLLSDDARLTEAAIILVQIVAEFSVNPPSLEWLSPDLPRDNYPYLRRSLQSKRDPLTGQLVREALATVDQWSKRRPRYESNIDEAIDTGGLVVVEATRQVYWKGELLKVDWKQKHKLPWKLLLSLVKSHWGVTEFDFYGEQDVSDSAYARLKHRLKGVLPADLFSQIHSVTCNDNNAYQIALPVQLIHVFLNEPASRLE
jgi:hypothetical protein